MFDKLTISSKIRGEYFVSFIDQLKYQLLIRASDDRSLFVIDQKVYALFNDEIKSVIERSRIILIECGEDTKTIEYCQIVIRQLLTHNVRKNDILVAIGGGITQDIVAFISSVLFRGVDWIFFPTTLLAQCDSCIGSKSSINFDQYKNLVGTFNPPSEIYIYLGFLKTLGKSEIKSGIGEMLHYFFNDGINLANSISEQYKSLLENVDLLAYFINNSLRIKKRIIEIDEFDTEIRHIFNYGHTFGHAIESITNYEIPHGQAISIGMDIANFISYKKQMISIEVFNQMHQILQKNMPHFELSKENIDIYLTSLSKDKKNKGNRLGCILTFGPGKMEKFFCDLDEDFKRLLLEYSRLYLS